MAGVRVPVMVHRRGTGRGRSGNGKPRVCLGGGGLLVDDGERWRGSWCGRAMRRRHRAASQIGRLKPMAPLGGSRLSDAYRFGMPGWAPSGLVRWAVAR
jgi:hypothetical protein